MGRYNEDFLRQAAEPHTETAKLLESLIAAKATLGSAVSRASTP
jgi:hypothetical protein